MEIWAKILIGLALLMISLGYLYRPRWITMWNAWGRDLLFNDAYLLHRRRWGLFLFVLALLFLYSGFQNLARIQAKTKPSSYLDLRDAYRASRAGEHRDVVARCRDILKRDPNNVHAWLLLGSAWSALGRPEPARNAWQQAHRIDPDAAGNESGSDVAEPRNAGR